MIDSKYMVKKNEEAEIILKNLINNLQHEPSLVVLHLQDEQICMDLHQLRI